MKYGKAHKLKDKILGLRNVPILEACTKLKESLATASSQEFLEMVMDLEAESARQLIDSILDQFDERRSQVLREFAESVPPEHKEFFIHAFSRRTPEDDPF
jgi:hypothetical protein